MDCPDEQPWTSLLECRFLSGDGVEDCDEFSHRCDHGEFEGFSAQAQSLIEVAENGVFHLDGAEHGHVGDIAQMFSSAKTAAVAIRCARLAGIRGNADECCGHLGGDLAEL